LPQQASPSAAAKVRQFLSNENSSIPNYENDQPFKERPNPRCTTYKCPPPADVGAGIGEKVINDFLAKHFEADPDFHKREKDPIWQADLPAKKMVTSTEHLKFSARS